MSGPLEHRYRRLLWLFPRAHRVRYEDEMIAVLMNDSAPGQRRPGVAATIDLCTGAAATRFRRGGRSLADGAWRRAAPVAALLIAVVLAVHAAPAVLFVSLYWSRVPATERTQFIVQAAMFVGWLAVVVPLLAGLRRVPATVAALLVAGQVVLLTTWLGRDPDTTITGFAYLALSVTALAALLANTGTARRPDRFGRRLALFAAATLVVEFARHPYSFRADWFTYLGSPPVSTVPSVLVAALVAALLVAAAFTTTRRFGTAVTLRVVVLLVPAVVLRALASGPSDLAHSLVGHDHPIALATVWYVLVVGVSLVSLALAVVALSATERLVRLIRLGRAAELVAAPGGAD